MKKYIVFILSLFLSLQLNAQVSVKKYIVISEVMYDSPLNEQIAQGIPYSNGEYIELYNLENTAVDLTGWKLTGGGKTEIYQFPANTIINPRSTLIVAYQYKDSGFLLNDLYSYDGYEMTTILYQRKIILNNSGETVSVVDNVGNVVDYITYDGTSNKTKPNRLSATNEDGTAGDHCKSLHRSLVLFDETNNIIFDPTHWKTELGNLFEVQIESPTDLPSQNKNYVLETTYTSSQSGRSCITYYDGLGRPCQTIDIAASPVNSQNIVSFVEYDCMGRSDSIVYLPYVTKSQSIILNDFKQIIRLYKEGTSTKIVSGTNLSLGEQLEKHLLLHFPFIKEAFFARCAIFVEGDSEYGSFPLFAKKCDIDLDDCGICVIQAGGDSVLQLIQLAEKFGIPCIGIRDSDGDNTPTSIPNLWKTTERDFEAELMKLIDIGREEVLCDILCEYDSEKQERILNAQALNKRAYKKYGYLTAPISTDLKLSDIDKTNITNLKAYYSTWFGINKSQPLGLLIGMKLSKSEIPQIYVNLIEQAKSLC